MQLADFSFRKSHDTNARKAHQLEEGGDMFLVATDAIEGFGEHNVELAISRTLKELLITRPEVARTRYATVCVCCDECPVFANNAFSANKELVFNRCRALQIG